MFWKLGVADQLVDRLPGEKLVRQVFPPEKEKRLSSTCTPEPPGLRGFLPHCISSTRFSWVNSIWRSEQETLGCQSPAHSRRCSSVAPPLSSSDYRGCPDQRLLVPRVAFFTFCLLDPRGVVRGALGAAFFRAARLIFLRSCVSSIFFVSAIANLFS